MARTWTNMICVVMCSALIYDHVNIYLLKDLQAWFELLSNIQHSARRAVAVVNQIKSLVFINNIHDASWNTASYLRKTNVLAGEFVNINWTRGYLAECLWFPYQHNGNIIRLIWEGIRFHLLTACLLEKLNFYE